MINLPSATQAMETRYDLDGDGRKDVLAVFQRRILIFFQTPHGGFSTAPDVEIGSGVPIPDTYAAVSVGKVAASRGMQLLLIGSQGVDFLTMEQLRGKSSQPVEPKQLLNKSFAISAAPNLQFLNCALDLSGEGKTCVVLPNSDQLEVYSPKDDGTYAASTRVYLPLRTFQQTMLQPEPSLLGGIAFADSIADPQIAQAYGIVNMVHTLPRLERWHGVQFAVHSHSDDFLLLDYNLDKRLDIVFPGRVLYQGAKGDFDSVASPAYSRIATALAIQRSRFVTAPNLVDFNGDGILDTFLLETSAAKLSPRTDVSIFLGRPDRSFAEQPDFVLHTRDFAYSEVIPIGDVNRDGAQDIALFHLDFQPSSASSQLKAYLRNGLDGDLRFYLWDKTRNRFPEGCDFKHRVLVNYEIYGTRQLWQQQVVINSDLDGDKFPDLVMKTGARQISVYKNLGASRGFSSRPMAVVETPTRFSSISVQDLNGDGRGDILLSGYVEDQDDRTISTYFISR